MRKLGVKHVERNSVWSRVGRWTENKFRFAINKSRDQPSRPDAVDLRTRTGQPCFPLILPYVHCLQLSRPLRSFGSPKQHRYIVSARTVEKIDCANLSKLPREPLKFCCCPFCIHFFSTRDETLNCFSQFDVIF